MELLALALYLAISIALTAWVAQTLSSNGIVFLEECFGHDARLARSTNHLLVVGFYLVNLGWILLTLDWGYAPTTAAETVRFLASKIGLVVVVLGFMHFFNMHALARFGRKVAGWLREDGYERPGEAPPQVVLR